MGHAADHGLGKYRHQQAAPRSPVVKRDIPCRDYREARRLTCANLQENLVYRFVAFPVCA